GGFVAVFVCFQVTGVDVASREPIRLWSQLFYFASKVAYQFNELINIADIRNVVYGYGFVCEQHCADDLERFVLCSLRHDLTGKLPATLYSECCHYSVT